jgi:hypothetical protein
MDGVNDLPEDLKRALDALDARAARAASGVDAGRVADRVLARLRTEPVEAAAPRWRTALRLAAAIAVLATGTVVVRVLTEGARPAAVAALPMDLPDSLSSAQAAALIEAVAAGSDSAGITAAAITVDDLDEAELRALLQAMQSDMEGAL